MEKSFIFPFPLQAIFIFSFLGYEDMLGEEYKYPEWSIKVGWAVTCSSVMCIPMYMIYKFFFASRGNCRERYEETFKPETNCNSAIPGQQGTNVWHGVDKVNINNYHNNKNNKNKKECSHNKFNNVDDNKTTSPTTTTAKLSPTTVKRYKNIYSNNLIINKNDNKIIPKYAYNNNNNNNTRTSTLTTNNLNTNNIEFKEPEYDISFKFKTQTQIPKTNLADYDYNDNDNLRYNQNSRCSMTSFHSIDSNSLNSCCSSNSYPSSHSNLINCNMFSSHLTANLCKLPLQCHYDGYMDQRQRYYHQHHRQQYHCYDHQQPQTYYSHKHHNGIAGFASTAANATTAPNAEDNNKKYTMILSRSCKPLKFSFASEWLV